MIHEVRQASNRAAAIVKWLEVIAAAVINQLDRHFFHCNYAEKIKDGFTPPYTQPCCLLQFNIEKLLTV